MKKRTDSSAHGTTCSPQKHVSNSTDTKPKPATNKTLPKSCDEKMNNFGQTHPKWQAGDSSRPFFGFTNGETTQSNSDNVENKCTSNLERQGDRPEVANATHEERKPALSKGNPTRLDKHPNVADLAPERDARSLPKDILITVTDIHEENVLQEQRSFSKVYPPLREETHEPSQRGGCKSISLGSGLLRDRPIPHPDETDRHKSLVTFTPERTTRDQLPSRVGTPTSPKRPLYGILNDEQDLEAEAEQRRERNRKAVMKCRERQRERYERLEQELAELIWENSKMRGALKFTESLGLNLD